MWVQTENVIYESIYALGLGKKGALASLFVIFIVIPSFQGRIPPLCKWLEYSQM